MKLLKIQLHNSDMGSEYVLPPNYNEDVAIESFNGKWTGVYSIQLFF